MKPTHEQEAIRAAFTSGMDLVVEAGAGTGKTTTLKMLANSDYARGRKGLYLAFNKAIATEAAGTFNSNVTCRTAHSHAFGFMSSKVGRAKYPGMKDKIFDSGMNLAKGFDQNNWYEAIFADAFPLQELPAPQKQVANHAEKGHPKLTTLMQLPNYGTQVELNAWDILKMIEETVRNYCISGDFRLGNQHVAAFDASARIIAKVNKMAFHKLMVARHLYTIERLHSGIRAISDKLRSGELQNADAYESFTKEAIKLYIPDPESFEIWQSNDRSNDKELTLVFKFLSDLLKSETSERSVAGKHAKSMPIDLKNIDALRERQAMLIRSFTELCVNANLSVVQGIVRGNRSLMSVYEPTNMGIYSPKRQLDVVAGWEFSFKLLDRLWYDAEAEQATKLYDFVLKHSRRAWEFIKDSESDISFGFDHILKMWQEAKPQLGYDFIFFDEAQDANPVMAELILSQNSGRSGSQVVVVGDENQSIYDFRGASGAMKMFKRHAKESSSFIIKQLTECFRFGPEIARAANNILAHTQSDLRLIGASPYDSELHTFPQVDWESTDAIICRQNSEILEAGIEAMQNGRVPIIDISAREMINTFDTLRSFMKAAQDGVDYQPDESSAFYGCTSYSEAWHYFQDSEDMRLERSLANSVKFNQTDSEGRLTESGINAVLKNLYDLDQARHDTDNPDRIDITSAHKSKGMEWDHITLWRYFGTTSISSNCPFERDDRGFPRKDPLDDSKYELKGDLVDQEYNINYVAITRGKKSVSLPLFTDNHDLSALIRYGSPYDTKGQVKVDALKDFGIAEYSASGREIASEAMGIEAYAKLEDSGLLSQLMLVTFNEAEDAFEAGPSLSFQPEPKTVDDYVYAFQKDTVDSTVAAMNFAYHRNELRAIPLYLATKRALEFKDKSYFLVSSVLGVTGRQDNKLNVERQLRFFDRNLREVSHGIIRPEIQPGSTDKSQEDQMIEMLAFLDEAPVFEAEHVAPFARKFLPQIVKEDGTAEVTLDDLADINESYQKTNFVLRVTDLPGFPVQARTGGIDPHAAPDVPSINLLDTSTQFYSVVSPFMPKRQPDDQGRVVTPVEDLLIGIKRHRAVYSHVELRKILRSYFHNEHANPLRFEADSTKSYIIMYGEMTEAEAEWEVNNERYQKEIADVENNDLSTAISPGPRPEGRVVFTAPIPPGTPDKSFGTVLLDALREYMTGVVVSDHERFEDQ